MMEYLITWYTDKGEVYKREVVNLDKLLARLHTLILHHKGVIVNTPTSDMTVHKIGECIIDVS